MDWLPVAVIPGFLELSFARRKSSAKGERSAPLTNSIPPLHQLPFVQTAARNLLGVGIGKDIKCVALLGEGWIRYTRAFQWQTNLPIAVVSKFFS
ncbi:hypothetical protein [Paenibacillus sp. MER 99-2]|uniref:hypothetical protein n=1 Tax=Paenibacillus sp. MER 99-2 TaxID=2939572 RepID=UPI00203E94AD|nr:hypothetical protein [Paenibacillus sp. MER 99-2]MCM3171397.1 hypothetical protein [Paenibacillus sp. MER 99-2]